jgi:NADPH:quinone reductase-like Zn-dependent oxidoreductase
MATHLAAVLHEAGKPMKAENRVTPTPNPDELLLEVKSVALNPIDVYHRDFGFHISHYPTVVGYDIGGIVLAAGSDVNPAAPKVGARVAAVSATFYTEGLPDYGALQTKCVVPADYVAEIPDNMSFNEASTFGMQITTTWAGWFSIGLSNNFQVAPSEKRGCLVWGASSSVGSGAVQTAKIQGFTVYATASEKHHEYVKTLGASRVFDYKDSQVVEKIVKAAREDGITVNVGYDAVGALSQCQAILKEWKPAKLASAPPLKPDDPVAEGVEQKFVEAPAGEKERRAHMSFVFNGWLKAKLADGSLIPSPRIQVIAGGLSAINEALDELKAGVSATKLVLEIA